MIDPFWLERRPITRLDWFPLHDPGIFFTKEAYIRSLVSYKQASNEKSFWLAGVMLLNIL